MTETFMIFFFVKSSLYLALVSNYLKNIYSDPFHNDPLDNQL